MKINDEIIIELKETAIGYRDKSTSKKLVKEGITIHALKGELVALIGGNGIGKSTLLKTIAGFLTPVGGRLLVEKRPVFSFSDAELALEMSYVSTEIVRVSNLSVFELVALGRFPHTNWLGKLTNDDRLKVEEAIHLVGLEGYESRMINQISDGERQRAMISRALAQDTRIIILDEPTAFLDVSNKYEIVHILHRLAEEKDKTIIFSTHDLNTAIAESDRIWLMLKENVVQGSPEDLILNGYFEKLFANNHLFFDLEKGDFRIKKLTTRKVVVNGAGNRLLWTIKALERIGMEISHDENCELKILINDENNDWELFKANNQFNFNQLYDLCRFLKSS